MPEIANPVGQVRQHLREAGALLTAKNFDGALAAVDAALAIDPASLPAQAMRERIVETQRRGAVRPVSKPVKVPVSPKPQQRAFVPSGVDAQSWLGFEQRIQERRFNSLLDQAQRALANQDGIAARIALEEARELRPHAKEIADLSARLALLPVAVPDSTSSSDFSLGARGLGAVGLLAAGVALLMGIEWMHPAQLTDRIATAAPIASSATAATEPQLPSQAIPTRTVTAPVASLTEGDGVTPEQPRPVPTSGVRRPVNPDRPAVGGPAATTTFQRAALVDPPAPANRGEVPDDYVAPQPRRPGYTNDGPAVATPRESVQTPLVAASPVVTPPAPTPPPVVAAVAPRSSPPPVVAAITPRTNPPAVVAASATIPPTRSDESRVAQVLNQYARAYGQLDASAARAVWPSVDERALARAFAGLASQAVSFDDCSVDVRGATATASCRGRTSYVGKVGSREPRSEQREWTFELRRGSDDAWKIERAKAQRME